MNASLNAIAPVAADGYWFSSALKFGGSFGAQLLLDFLVAGAALGIALLLRNRKPVRGMQVWALCLVAGTLGVIAISTLTRRAGATSPGHLQLEPFGTLRRYTHDAADFLIYLGGNVAMFIPLGLFLYLALRRWMLLCAALATLVSIGVELLQLPIYSRATDIDDVITNGLGGLIGAVLGVVVVRVARSGRLGSWAQGQVVDVDPPTDEPAYPRSADTRPAGIGVMLRVPGEPLPAPPIVRSPDAASAWGHAASPWRP
nr:VanZ family protein [Kineosporia babensis]